MMKKFFKWSIIFAAALFIGMYVFLYIWFHNKIDVVMIKTQQDWLVDEISNSPKLPDNVYSTLEKYHPEFYSENSWNYNLKRIFGRPERRCQCNEIYLPYIPVDTVVTDSSRPWVPFDQHALLIKIFIEKYVTQKDCFTFNMNNNEFGGNTKGMRKASNYYFKKELKELTEKEIVGLYVIQFAPSLYNPLRNKEKYDAAVNAIMKQ